MPDKRLCARVIGCGRGANHAYANASEFELVSVCDLGAEVLERFRGRSRPKRGSARQYAIDTRTPINPFDPT